MVIHAGEARTKVVCTLGPASRAPEVLRRMIRTGMDVARVNYSHGTPEEHARTIETVRRIATEENATVAILADLQGPKLRIGALALPLDLAVGARITLTDRTEAAGDAGIISLPHPELISGARVGGRLVFADGEPEAVIRVVRAHEIVAEITVEGRLSSHLGVAAPGGTEELDVLTAKDCADARAAVSSDVDYIALSFVRSRDDVQRLRAHVATIPGGEGIGLIAKIEKKEAIDALDGILRASDAVMVARGDLGVELSPQEVPILQKEIIRRCNRLGKPVITATQMLQSMTDNPRPTRAEASDVANAILDGTDAVMLSAETAVGRHPVETVAMMQEIARITERHLMRRRDDGFEGTEHAHPITDAISDATARIADEVGARLIVTSTWSGYTARQIARERSHHPIVALTPSLKVQRQLALVWGVLPVQVPTYEGTDEMLRVATRTLLEGGYAAPGDLVVFSAGIPTGGGGKTNFLKVHRIESI